MKTTPAHRGAGTDERPRSRASFRVSFSNAEPNQLYSRSRDFSILVEDDLAQLLVDGDRVDDLVEQLAVDGDREPRRCGGGGGSDRGRQPRSQPRAEAGPLPWGPDPTGEAASRRDPNE